MLGKRCCKAVLLVVQAVPDLNMPAKIHSSFTLRVVAQRPNDSVDEFNYLLNQPYLNLTTDVDRLIPVLASTYHRSCSSLTRFSKNRPGDNFLVTSFSQ
ncbi:hypothetical protein M378DRAFT_422673 [Amanita muscaria Koide BX008]|uniref:Uncharacterized protein n=1 Tax=Amanita muscaria (strain Koide BX008) TaxID=946122 RepID=A0A0C2WK21_AMAMK|nr:hypothetical protein M378DRAFT_422673 [Amanita muscaria Koide BX008]